MNRDWRETLEVQFVEFNGRKFYFVDFGKEIHGKKSFRLWINRRLIPEPDENGNIVISFPLVGSKVVTTEKGNYVLRPQQGWWTSIFIKYCGYRGISKCEILSPKDIISIPYKIFESPQGNLGISEGLLFSAPESEVVIIEWKRTGRLYGSEPKGTARLFPNGVIEEISLRAEELSEIEKYL